MELTSHSLIHNGQLKLNSSTLEGKTYEYMETGDTVHVLLVETQDNPLFDIITCDLQFSVGAFASLKEESVYSCAVKTINNHETATDAAHNIAAGGFGACGHVYKLGSVYKSSVDSTHVSNLFWMDVVEWNESAKGDGFETNPKKLSLDSLLMMIKSPYNVMDASFCMAVMLYAAYRGV